MAQRVTGVEIWIVSAVVLLSMATSSLLPWVAACIVLMGGIRWLAWGNLTIPTKFDIPLIVLTLIIPLNYWISPLPEKSFPQLLRLLVGIGFFYAIVNDVVSKKNAQPRKSLGGMLWIVLMGAVGLAMFALISVEWAANKLPFIPERLYSYATILVGDTVHPNVMAGTLVILLPIPLGIFLFAGGEFTQGKKLVFILSIFFIGTVLLITQSRGALIGFGFSLLCLSLLRWRRWGWMVLGMAIAFGALLVWQMGIERVLDAVLVSATLGGAYGREQIWQRAIYMIQDFPFTGVGMGLFGDVADTLYPFVGVEPGKISHAHQLFFQVAVDLGLIGFSAWLTTFVLVILSTWQVYSCGVVKTDRWMMGLGAGLLASQVALFVHGLLDAVTWGMVRPAPLVWGVWGFAVAAYMLKERE